MNFKRAMKIAGAKEPLITDLDKKLTEINASDDVKRALINCCARKRVTVEDLYVIIENEIWFLDYPKYEFLAVYNRVQHGLMTWDNLVSIMDLEPTKKDKDSSYLLKFLFICGLPWFILYLLTYIKG